MKSVRTAFKTAPPFKEATLDFIDLAMVVSVSITRKYCALAIKINPLCPMGLS